VNAAFRNAVECRCVEVVQFLVDEYKQIVEVHLDLDGVLERVRGCGYVEFLDVLRKCGMVRD
jgi:hypothetical protein